MSGIIDRAYDGWSNVSETVWDWFNRLTREEWIVVLVVVSVLGFMCMLGYGSRTKY